MIRTMPERFNTLSLLGNKIFMILYHTVQRCQIVWYRMIWYEARVEAQNLRRQRANWIRLDHNLVPDFPILTVNKLENITFGTYQIGLARSYVQDKIIRDNDQEFQLD